MLEIKNETEFTKEVEQQPGFVVADFNATWCGPCQMLAPVLEQIAAEESAVHFVGINVDENSELAQKFGVMSIPCLVFFKDGKEVKRQSGFAPKSVIQEIIKGLKS